MSRCRVECLKRAAVLAIGLVVLVGCAPPVATVPPPPTVSPTQADLTALAPPVWVARNDNTKTNVTEDQTVVIGLNDLIQVPESGHAMLDVGQRISTDVFRSSELSVSDAQPQPGGAIFARLNLKQGHTRVALRQGADARVRLETGFGTITTLEPGTEFLVCHDPALLTCLVVRKGSVEVVAQGKVVRVKGGEATYILKDKAPFPPICSQPAQVDTWINEKLGTGAVQPLGALVADWPQEPCAAATAPAAQAAATGASVATSTPAPGAAGTPAATGAPTATSTSVPLPSSDGMVKIPAGTYTIGSTAQDNYHIAPMQKKLAAFWIDTHEVTNGQYQAFLDATSHATPVAWPGKPDFPIAGVSWNDAAAFCAWAHKRLPGEAEWEVAGRGPGDKPPLYPWGDDPLAGGKINALPLTETYPAGSIAFNVSPFGVFDMAGNVWEWVGNPYYPVDEGMKILRGGRYGLIQDMAYRQQAAPADPRFVPVAGFRCAADKVQGE